MKRFNRYFALISLLCALLCAAAAGNPAPVGAVTPPEELFILWPVQGTIIKGFNRQHSGIDIKAAKYSAVKAAAPGNVLYAGWWRGYGQVVIIAHGYNYSTVYAHMSSSTQVVKKGDAVESGSIVGTVGNTGTVAGYHLHFEVRKGSKATNPLRYLKH